MKTTLSNHPDAWHEVDQLIRQLHSWGVTYLVGLDHTADLANSFDSFQQQEQVAPVVLIQRLAQCDEFPRVRDACIALFLLHPELPDSILEALQASTTEVAEQIAVLTLATLYLQRLWSIRLTLVLGHAPCFPEARFAFLWQNRQLPSPSCHSGKRGLLALEEGEQKRTGLPLSFLGDWQNQLDHLLQQEEAQRHSPHSLITPLIIAEQEEQNGQECNMSMRPGVDNRDIADVKLLVQEEMINLPELDIAYQEALAQLGKGRYPRVTPQRFSERYQGIRKLL